MNIRISLGICLFLSTLLMNGCATIIAASCNPNSAYAAGVNDAKNGIDMKYDYAAICPSNNV